MKRTSAIYPGTFDPVTNGHLDIVERSSKLFGQVIVVILVNPQKEPLFSSEERTELIRQSIPAGITNVDLDAFESNLDLLLKRMGSAPVTLRIATKSVRHVGLLRHALDRAGTAASPP